MGKREKPNYVLAIGSVALIGAFLWLNQEQLGGLTFEKLTQSLTPSLALLPIVAGFVLLWRFQGRQARRYVNSLAYAITDQRVIILYDGKDPESYTPSQLERAKLEERAGAEGYYDIVWGGRAMTTNAEGRVISNPLNLERARMGFKALRDGRDVMARIESLCNGQS